jgi:hypothetical protein
MLVNDYIKKVSMRNKARFLCTNIFIRLSGLYHILTLVTSYIPMFSSIMTLYIL